MSGRCKIVCVSATIAASLAIVATRAFENVTFTDVTKESRIAFSHISSPDKKYILESMSGGVAVFNSGTGGRDVEEVLAHEPGDPAAAKARNRVAAVLKYVVDQTAAPPGPESLLAAGDRR